MIGVEAEWYMPPEEDEFFCPDCGEQVFDWYWDCDPDANKCFKQPVLCAECQAFADAEEEGED